MVRDPASFRPGGEEILPQDHLAVLWAEGDINLGKASPRKASIGSRSLIDQIRDVNPAAAIRSNFIVGFPGEAPADIDVLIDFLQRAQLDAIGVFGYSDEQGTEAATFSDHVDADEIDLRVEALASVAEDVMSARAGNRIGESVRVLVEAGKTQFQGPEDGSTQLLGSATGPVAVARIVASEGADLIAEIVS